MELFCYNEIQMCGVWFALVVWVKVTGGFGFSFSFGFGFGFKR